MSPSDTLRIGDSGLVGPSNQSVARERAAAPILLDGRVAPVEYNFRDRKALEQMGLKEFNGMEVPGVSVFFRDGEHVFHTYSSYARGTEVFLTTYRLLDLTALGRQEEWEEPRDRFTGPVKALLRHDKYDPQ